MIPRIFNQACWIFELNNMKIENEIESLIIQSQFLIVGTKDHTFIPYGFTKIWLLGESHMALHTFPEEAVSYIELSSCVEDKSKIFWSFFKKWTETSSIKIKLMQENFYSPR